MKYTIENVNPLTKEFGELKEGDLFLYKNPVDSRYGLFMKMNKLVFSYKDYGVMMVNSTQYPPIKETNNINDCEVIFNAVCLSNGMTRYFCDNDKITCIDYDLKIYKLFSNITIRNEEDKK